MAAESKCCAKCKGTKPITDFYIDKSRGARPWCKACDLEANRKQRQQPDYKAKKREQQARYYARPEVKARVLARSKKYRRKSYLKYKFGLAPEDIDTMKVAQSSRCAICGEVFKKSPCIDHNHETGQVRGLLCNGCNLGLGLFKDDAQTLTNASQYLTSWLEVTQTKRGNGWH